MRTRVAFAGLRALYPAAHIEWLVEDRAAGGLDGIVGLDGTVVVPRRQLALGRRGSLARLRDLIHTLRDARYDLVVDFHGILKSALLAFASRAPIRLGYDAAFAREWSALFYTHRASPRPRHQSRFDRNAALVRYLGGDVPVEAPPLGLDERAHRFADALAFPSRPVALHPGTSASTRYKRWDSERYAAVATRLRDAYGIGSLVTWGPTDGEEAAAREVVQAAGGAALLAPRTERVADLLALLRRTRLFIGSDSGPMHLAALAGIPLVVLYGPTDPVENGPFSGVPSRAIRHDVGCNPCREGCPARTCMAAVTVEEVVEAAARFVAGSEPVH